jgi:hypothetical protein
MMTHKELLLLLERRLRTYADKNGKIAVEDLQGCINSAMCELDTNEKTSIPVQKFIFVEDGSVDADELIETLAESNPEIKVIVYRQGAATPELVEVK